MSTSKTIFIAALFYFGILAYIAKSAYDLVVDIDSANKNAEHLSCDYPPLDPENPSCED